MRERAASGAAIVALLLSASVAAAQTKAPSGAPAQPRELRITVQTPPKSINNGNLEFFRKRVETAT
jgi:TRAP-type C4-dicarboxylate transport system substrate-binding protein